MFLLGDLPMKRGDKRAGIDMESSNSLTGQGCPDCRGGSPTLDYSRRIEIRHAKVIQDHL